jgi:hypothetical protein
MKEQVSSGKAGTDGANVLAEKMRQSLRNFVVFLIAAGGPKN